MYYRFLFGLAAFALIFIAPVSEAGIIVASGDVTPVFHLTDTLPDSAFAGNGQFFENVLGAGTSVAVLETSLSLYADTEIDEFYDGLTGVSSNLFSGEVTAGILSGVDLLLLPIPDNDFTADEINTIVSFVIGGGSLFLLAEGLMPDTRTRVNSILSAGGSSMFVNTPSVDTPGTWTAEGSRIVANPLTAGITGFKYGATFTVSGGTGLFLTLDSSNNQPFIAFETANPVPEPATILFLGSGLVWFAGFRKRFKKS
jgi:hypothetical protein